MIMTRHYESDDRLKDSTGNGPQAAKQPGNQAGASTVPAPDPPCFPPLASTLNGTLRVAASVATPPQDNQATWW